MKVKYCMADKRHSNREDKAVDALIIAALLSDLVDVQEIDLAADEAELTQADRAQLDSLPADFVQRIVEGGWVSHSAKANDDTSNGDEYILDRVTS
jgi:hypothetical protein